MKDESSISSERVLDSIKSRHITPRSKGYFALLTVLSVVGVTAVALAVLYLASLVHFNLRQSGAWFLPGFGVSAFGAFMASLPWLLIISLIVLVVLVVIMVRRYAFSYGQPVLYSILGLILFVVIGAAVVSRTELHSMLMKEANEHRLPAGEMIYRHYGDDRTERVIPCTVVKRTDTGYVARNENNQLVSVVLSDGDADDFSEFRPGDIIAVLGDCEGMTIRADAIRKIDRLPALPPAHKNRPTPCGF